MNEIPNPARLPAANWFKSSYSAADNECVEVVGLRSHVSIRDSKTSGRGVLTLPVTAFAAFIGGVKADDCAPAGQGTAVR